MSKIQTIIFDFDGTLADTFPVILEIFHHVQKRTVRLTKEEEHAFRAAVYKHVPVRTIIKSAVSLNLPLTRLPALFILTQFLLRKRMDEVQPFPGIVDTVTQLHKDGHTLYIVSTNSAGNVKKFLLHVGLQGCFTRIYGGVPSSRKYKVISRIARNHGGEDASMYIGDETRDIRATKKAGVQSVAVTWGYNDEKLLRECDPDFIVLKPSEILELIGK